MNSLVHCWSVSACCWVVFVSPSVRHILLLHLICFSQRVVFIQQLSPSQYYMKQEEGEGHILLDIFNVFTAMAVQDNYGPFLCPSCCCFSLIADPAVCLLGDEYNLDNACWLWLEFCSLFPLLVTTGALPALGVSSFIQWAALSKSPSEPSTVLTAEYCLYGVT